MSGDPRRRSTRLGGRGPGGWLVRNPRLRTALLAVLALSIILGAVVPLASMVVESWSRRDSELQARLIFTSIREQISAGLSQGADYDPTPAFERLAKDERLLALGYCTADGEMRFRTRAMPATIGCDGLDGDSLPDGKENSRIVELDRGQRALLNVFSLTGSTAGGRVLVVLDLSHIDRRLKKVQLYTLLALIGVALGTGVLAATAIMTLMRGWTRALRAVIADVRLGGTPRDVRFGTFPIGREINKLLGEIRVDRKFTDGIHVEWSPTTLHQLLAEELPGAQVMVVSNRQPYIHNRVEGDIRLQIPASGLVAALEPVMRACGGTWIAHGSGSADAETVDRHDRLRVPPADPTYTLRRVWLSDEEQDGYYYGFANEGMWPLCHIAFVRPTFRETDWAQYKAVNARFADIVVEEATCEDPIILVQDYHFALLLRMIRDRLPKATVITFWHIPWPNAETFGICPWREEIIDGLLGSTILGFHTQFHCNNFLEAADRFMESRIDRENASITLGGHKTLIRPYPISIEWPPAALASQAPVPACRQAVIERLGLPEDVRIAVGIERFDYTKGILDRIRAVDELLTLQPEWLGKFAFIQAAAPTRGKLGAYSALQEEAERLAAEVNARHGSAEFQPIRLVIRHHDPHEVFELFRAADMCVVSSLHDGMNLVAKEFVASRDDEQGVLILSSFAGASRELSEALIVNPYDTHGMAKAFGDALRMARDDQRERMRLMRDLVRRRNVHRWAAQMLLDTAWLRRRERILSAA